MKTTDIQIKTLQVIEEKLKALFCHVPKDVYKEIDEYKKEIEGEELFNNISRKDKRECCLRISDLESLEGIVYIGTHQNKETIDAFRSLLDKEIVITHDKEMVYSMRCL